MLAEELNRVHFKSSPVGGDPTGAAAVGSVPLSIIIFAKRQFEMHLLNK